MASRSTLLQGKVWLDATPTGSEEWEDWLSETKLQPTWDPDQARLRIDKIARRLATAWSAFLIYMIIAQGIGTGFQLQFMPGDYRLTIVPKFHLQTAEFIAVVTTTTAAVFGFLVIVSRGLFKEESGTQK